jgi:hypothetical protein
MKRLASMTSCILAITVALTVVSPCFAVYSDLQVSVVSIDGNVLTLAVHNPTSEVQSARIVVGVQLHTGLNQLLSSGGVQVAPDDTVEVQIQASGSVSGILDEPGPVPF